MAQPQTSFGGSIGLAEEVTYGTAVARTNWLEIVSCTLDREIDYQPEPTLGRIGDAGRVPRRKYVASDNSGGEIEWVMAYDDSTLMMMKHAFGGVSTTGSGPYTHTCTLAALPIGLTIEKAINSSKGEVFEGCKITDLTVSIDAGGLMMGRASIVGETSGGLVSSGTPTYTSALEEVKHHQAGQFSFNSVSYDISSMSVTLANGVDRRQVLGSSFTKEPTPQGKREVTMSVTYEYIADTPHTAFLAGTESDAAITFTGTGNNSLAITLHNAYITSVATPVQGPGIVTQTIELRGQSDGSDLGLSFVFINDNVTATSN